METVAGTMLFKVGQHVRVIVKGLSREGKVYRIDRINVNHNKPLGLKIPGWKIPLWYAEHEVEVWYDPEDPT
jgi:hypothetical protein